MEPRARLELAFPDYRSGASPSMLTGLVILEPMERIERSSVAYHATALPLSYIGWSQRGYSKSRPPRYECGALPPELLRAWSECGESNSVDPDWRSDAQPIGHTCSRTFGADGDNRESLLRVGGPGHTLYTTPAHLHLCDAIQLSKSSIETHLYCVASERESELDKMPQNSPVKTKKAGGQLWWPPAS